MLSNPPYGKSWKTDLERMGGKDELIDAWIVPDATKIGYEVSFTRYFYQPQSLRTLAEIRKDIKALEKETGGLLEEIIGANTEAHP